MIYPRPPILAFQLLSKKIFSGKTFIVNENLESYESFPPQTFYHIIYGSYIVFLIVMIQVNFNLTLACTIPTCFPLIFVCKL